MRVANAWRPTCLTLYRLKWNVSLENDRASQSYVWPWGESSRSVRAVIEKPHDSLLTQHTMWTANRGITEPLGNKKSPTASLSVSVKHAFTHAVSFSAKRLLISWSRLLFPQRFHPHINQLQIPRLIVFGQSASAACYKQMPVGSAGGGSLSRYATIAHLFEAKCFLVRVKIVLFRIMFNSKEQFYFEKCRRQIPSGYIFSNQLDLDLPISLFQTAK